MTTLDLSPDDLDRLRQWYNALQDTASAYLQPADAELAQRIGEAIGWATPGRPGRASNSAFWQGYAAGKRGAAQGENPLDDPTEGDDWERGRLKAFGEGLQSELRQQETAEALRDAQLDSDWYRE